MKGSTGGCWEIWKRPDDNGSEWPDASPNLLLLSEQLCVSISSIILHKPRNVLNLTVNGVGNECLPPGGVP